MSTLYEQVTELTTKLIGHDISGKYELQGVLGRGGMSAVFEAIQNPMGRKVAVKVIPSSASTAAQRFEREASVSAKLVHPNIVTVFDFGQFDGKYLYLAMEYLEGKTLGDLMRESDVPLEPRRAVAIATQVGKALGRAHQEGVVHRDVKPDNIFLTEIDGQTDFVKVLDFGIAKAFEDNTEISLTMDGHVVGTPIYISPEQIRDEPLGPAADVYSLACIVYEMLVGRPPFKGHINALFLSHLQEPPPTFDKYLKDDDLLAAIPEALQEVIHAAMAKRPEERPESTEAFCELLQRAVEGAKPAELGLLDTDELPDRGSQPPEDQATLAEMVPVREKGFDRNISDALDDPEWEVELETVTKGHIQGSDASGEQIAEAAAAADEEPASPLFKAAVVLLPILALAAILAAIVIDQQKQSSDPAVDDKPPQKPSTLQFKVDGAGVQYYFRDRKGESQPANKLAKIPPEHLSAVHVYIAAELSKVKLAPKEAYIVNLLDAEPGDSREAILRMESDEAVEQPRDASLSANDIAIQLSKNAELFAVETSKNKPQDEAPE